MEVQCTFKHIPYSFGNKNNKNLAGYSCRVNKIIYQLSSSSCNEIIINGSHQENFTNFDVIGVDIQNQPEIQKFPRGFGEIFPNLKYLQIRRCSLNTLKKEDFLDLGHLQGLWLGENQIVSLPNDLFQNVQGIKYICFHKNKLKYIGKDLLKPLKSLERANFTENTCINLNYIENHEELIQINQEITSKCQFPIAAAVSSSENSFLESKIDQLTQKVLLLESKIKRLESEKQLTDAKISQIAPLEQLIYDLQSRFETIVSKVMIDV